MKLLCNVPLECFEERARLQPFEVVTFGPPGRMHVDGVHYPLDIAFDPAEESIHTLLGRLPRGFTPDILLLYWPDQEPLPADLEQCPFPVVGVVSDYNLSLPYISGLWPFFDVLLTDRSGVELFGTLPFADVRWWCQFTFKAPSHRLLPGIPRDLDVGFAGNLNPTVQRERAPWIERVQRLAARGIRVDVRGGVHGAAYGRFLNRCRIGFNRSIRGEMNLRAFEVPACGALLFMERDNREVREFLTAGEEFVAYGDNDFEALVSRYLEDEPGRARIARAGHERILGYSLRNRLDAMRHALQTTGPGRPPSTAADRALGRGTALLTTWSSGNAALRELVAASKLAPDDPRPLNAMALAMLRRGGAQCLDQAIGVLQVARTLAPDFLPARWNLALLTGQPRPPIEAMAASAIDPRQLDGPVLPLIYSREAIDWAQRLGQCIRRRLARGTPAGAAAFATAR